MKRQKRLKRLPSGLQEFEGSLHDLKYIMELFGRLRDLPREDFSKFEIQLKAAMIAVEKAEWEAMKARDAARRVALKAWAIARRGWTVKQLQKATGYDHE